MKYAVVLTLLVGCASQQPPITVVHNHYNRAPDPSTHPQTEPKRETAPAQRSELDDGGSQAVDLLVGYLNASPRQFYDICSGVEGQFSMDEDWLFCVQEIVDGPSLTWGIQYQNDVPLQSAVAVPVQAIGPVLAKAAFQRWGAPTQNEDDGAVWEFESGAAAYFNYDDETAMLKIYTARGVEVASSKKGTRL